MHPHVFQIQCNLHVYIYIGIQTQIERSKAIFRQLPILICQWIKCINSNVSVKRSNDIKIGRFHIFQHLTLETPLPRLHPPAVLRSPFTHSLPCFS